MRKRLSIAALALTLVALAFSLHGLAYADADETTATRENGWVSYSARAIRQTGDAFSCVTNPVCFVEATVPLGGVPRWASGLRR